MTNPHDGAKSALSAATAVIAAVLAILGGLLWALAIGDAVRWIGDTRAQPNLSDQARSWFNAAALALTVGYAKDISPLISATPPPESPLNC